MALNVGLVGCGNIAQMMHIPYLMEYEQFNLVALSDVYQPILDAVGDRYGIAQRFTDWNDMFASDEIDAVVLCHAGSHRDAIIAALDAGKHVFVEKPVGWNVREVREVAERVAASDRILQVGYHKRYDPAFQYVREHVQNMNDIGMVRITVLHPPDEMGHTPHRIRRGNDVIRDGHIDVAPWDQQIQGMLNGLTGGDLTTLVDEALGDLRKDDPRLRVAYSLMTISIIHQVYTLFGLLGEPQEVLSTDIWRDGVSIHSVLAFPDDVRCTIDWHFLAKLKHYSEEYAFFGNQDRVMWRLPSPYFKNFPSPVTIEGGEGELAWQKTVTVSYDEAFRNELLAFYDNVQNGTEPQTHIREAVKHHELIQKMIDAAR